MQVMFNSRDCIYKGVLTVQFHTPACLLTGDDCNLLGGAIDVSNSQHPSVPSGSYGTNQLLLPSER